jgi:capsular exopolysaccharide synthesis family protein
MTVMTGDEEMGDADRGSSRGEGRAPIRADFRAPPRPHVDIRSFGPERIAAEQAEEPQFSESLLNIWNIVVKWRWLIAAASVLGLGAGVAATITTTPLYHAVAKIQIDLEPVKLEMLQSQQSANYGDPEKYYLTQYELLKSRSLAERVARQEDLADDPAFLSATPGSHPPLTHFGPRPRRLDRAADLVSKGLHIDPVRASRLVNISYQSSNPATAARIANAVATDFISWNLERRYDASAAARQFLEARLKQTREALDDYERQGDAYAQRNRLITVGAGASQGADEGKLSTGESIEATDLASLDGALSSATAARILARQHWDKAQATADTALPEVLADPAFEALRATRDTALAEYDQNLRRFKPNFPSMVADKARIDAISAQIAQVAGSVREGLRVQYENAQGVENSLKSEVERKKNGLLADQGRRVQEGFINTDISTSRALYDSMLATYKQLGISGAVEDNNISIVDRARPNFSPIQPIPMNNLLLFGSAGVAIGVMLAFILEQFDLSIKVPEDIERLFGVPVLATIPVIKGNVAAWQALENPRSQISEGYYSARAALQLSTADGVPASILVTSSMVGEGKSTSALALAAGFGRLGMRVLLIDADMRIPSQHMLLSRDNSVGLSNLLAGGPGINAALQPTGFTNVTLLAAGPPPPNPSELLAGPKMAIFLQAMSEHFDLVVVDGPPIMGLADAPHLSRIAAGVLMVVEAGATKRAVAKAALRRLRGSGAHVLGVLFTKFDIMKAGYAYGYGYGGGYGYRYVAGENARQAPIARLTRFFRGRKAA